MTDRTYTTPRKGAYVYATDCHPDKAKRNAIVGEVVRVSGNICWFKDFLTLENDSFIWHFERTNEANNFYTFGG